MANQGGRRHHDGMTDDKKPAASGTPGPAPEPDGPKPDGPKPPGKPPDKPRKVEEIGGPPGPEPTRYGDWQFNGKVTDF